jgi:hypothetical protein
MATTSLTSTNALAIKLYGAKTFYEMMKGSWFGHMTMRGSLMRAEKLDRAERGDNVTVPYVGRLTGLGITEGGTLTGNEEALDTQAFTMQWNVVRHAVLSPNDDTIEQTRTHIPFHKSALEQLKRWHMSRMDASLFNQLAGNNATTINVDGTVYSGAKRTIVQGLNSIAAPTSDRVIRAGGVANDEALTSSNRFTLDLVDAAVELAARTYPNIDMLDNEEFDLYLSPEQITDLKRDTTGTIQWYTNATNMLAGGKIDDNPITMANSYGRMAVAKYANVNIYSAFRVANGVNSTNSVAISNVRRAVLVGRDAALFASKFSGALTDGTKNTDGNTPIMFTDQLKDYDYERGVEARALYGMKKLQFDGQDYGSIVISTYAAPHTN